jgi:hypothetical protein
MDGTPAKPLSDGRGAGRGPRSEPRGRPSGFGREPPYRTSRRRHRTPGTRKSGTRPGADPASRCRHVTDGRVTEEHAAARRRGGAGRGRGPRGARGSGRGRHVGVAGSCRPQRVRPAGGGTSPPMGRLGARPGGSRPCRAEGQVPGRRSGVVRRSDVVRRAERSAGGFPAPGAPRRNGRGGERGLRVRHRGRGPGRIRGAGVGNRLPRVLCAGEFRSASYRTEGRRATCGRAVLVLPSSHGGSAGESRTKVLRGVAYGGSVTEVP